MRAEFVIKYKHGDIVDVLSRRYGASDLDALHASELWEDSRRSAAGVTYAARTPKGLVVMAWSTGGRAEVYVESSTGRLRDCSEQVWEAIREEGRRLEPQRMKPKLHSLELVDLPGDVVATATVGIAKVLRDQMLGPVFTGAVTAVVLGLALLSKASETFVYGSITPLAVAILSLASLIVSSRSKKLAWR